MNDNTYHKLIGENIQEVEIFNFKPIRKENSSFYSLFFETPKLYNNNAIYFIFITTDENNIITSIKLSFVSLIDKSFFNDFTLLYGEPDKILITDRIITESEPVKGSFGSIIIERESELKEGSFEEDPLLLFWEKDNFEIDVSMNYMKNQTDISFKKSDMK